MIGRSVQGLPGSTNILSISRPQKTVNRRGRFRRTFAAFLIGAGFIAIGYSSLRAGVAAGFVNSANSPIAFILERPDSRDAAGDSDRAAPNFVWRQSDPAGADKRSAHVVAVAAVQGAASLPRRSVCVRLCDGYFFPIAPISRPGDLANHEAACAGLCPDAPTQLFVEPAGSDNIADAVSMSGERYSSLPVAFRNRTVSDNTCGCRRRPGAAFSLRDDFTLRKGDSVMTASGFMVFRGAAHMPLRQNDFATLAKSSMPKERRSLLAAIERATLPTLHGSSEAFLAPPRARMAFAAPALERSAAQSSNKSIRFVEFGASTSN
jgi:hypothetical protein